MTIERIKINHGVTIYKRPDSKCWQFEFHLNGMRRRFSLKVNTKQEALRLAPVYAERFKAQMWQIPVSTKVSLDELIQVYLNDHAYLRNRQSTINLNLRTLEKFKVWFTAYSDGKQPYINRITSTVVLDYLKWRRPEISVASLNRELRILRTVFNFAVKKGLLPHSPVSGVDMFEEDRKLPRTLSTSDIEKLLEKSIEPIPMVGRGGKGKGNYKSRSRTLHNLILFLLNTGARLGEALYLKKEDVDFENNMIRFRSKEEYKLKDRQERAVPINHALRSILEEQIASNNGSEWVFCTTNGKPYSKSTITHRLYDTAVRAGIQRVSFKMFRNTFATLNAQTMPPFVVKELLGHSSIATTEKYYVGKLNSFCPVPVVFNK